MFRQLSDFLWLPPEEPNATATRHQQVEIVGTKACGLALFPPAWTPPFVVISAAMYRRWLDLSEPNRRKFLRDQLQGIEHHVVGWADAWPGGLALRSSAISETLGDRGAHETVELTADYSTDNLSSAISRIYSSFEDLGTGGSIAIVVQARAQLRAKGHLSDERRVSKTVNHWMCELEGERDTEFRFNSQRADPPRSDRALGPTARTTSAITAVCRRIGRWCTGLNLGPVHVELGVAKDGLWLFQLDVEDDQPDEGENPANQRLSARLVLSEQPPSNSPFRRADFSGQTGWPKIDKVREFLHDRIEPYPTLFFATGDSIEEALSRGRDISSDILKFAGDRVVCRTECVAEGVERLNLPRTDTVRAKDAAAFIVETLRAMKDKGIASSQVCFILHRFIPARAAAWALADPNRQVVRIDALWGLPDGLQYLAHDTFEYDTRQRALSAETARYKPLFLQETESGQWKLARVARKHARNRCISARDIREIADVTHAIAKRLNQQIQVMWFCGIEPAVRIGRNVPWFMMAAGEHSRADTRIAPNLPRVPIRTVEDLSSIPQRACVLELEPDVNLYRSQEFLESAASVARARSLPVVLKGSTLGHAFYTLERKGVTVVATEGSRFRARQKQVFRKLVRDEIPERILEGGEAVSVAKIAKSESRAALVIKLFEESHELLGAEDPTSVTAELADLLEVVRSLCLATGTDLQQVERAADQKRSVRGSFEKNVVLMETSWPTWKGPKQKNAKDTIALEELGKVTDNGRRHVVNFAASVAGGAGTIHLSDGTKLEVRITDEGVEITEVSDEEMSSTQLSFDFEE